MKKMKRENKGFTLAELLIVVAIIAVLVAISIPIFTAQLEKAREATDAANIRAAYAEVSANLLTYDGGTTDRLSIDVDCKQKTPGWQGTNFNGTDLIGGKQVTAANLKGWTVTANPAETDNTKAVTITEKAATN